MGDTMKAAERQRIRRLAHRYATIVQSHVYQQICAELVSAGARGEDVSGNTDEARRAAWAGATNAVQLLTLPQLDFGE